MATVYGSYKNGSWRAYMTYTISNGSIEVSACGVDVKDGYYIDYPFTATLSATGYSSSSSSSRATGNKRYISDKSYSWTKTHSSQTKTVTFKLKNTYNDNVSSVSVSVTVPAKSHWTVSYSANGGSGAPSSQTKWEGETLTLSSTKPTRTGYIFDYWTARGYTFSPGATTTYDGDQTMTAHWTEKTATLTYKSNGHGTVRHSSVKMRYSTATTVDDGPTGATGYTFQKWNTKADGSGTTYTVGYTINKANVVPSSVTLYAIWKANTYTVSYHANGGSAGSITSQTKTYGVNMTISSSATPTRSGWTFKGWATSSSSSTVAYKAGGTYSTNASIDLYAVWTKTVTLSYNMNGGSGSFSSQSATITSPSTNVTLKVKTGSPTRTNYKFLGWSLSSTATSATYRGGSSITITQNNVLYAVWQLDYIAPKFVTKFATRYDESKSADDDEGTSGHIRFTWKNAKQGTTELTTEPHAYYRESGASSWITISLTTSGTTASAIFGNGGLSTDKLYDILFVLTPYIGSTEQTKVRYTTYISKAAFAMDVNANGTSFGFFTAAANSDDNTVRFNGTIKAKAIMNDCDEGAINGSYVRTSMRSIYIKDAKTLTTSLAGIPMAAWFAKGSDFSISSDGYILCNFDGYAFVSGFVACSSLTSGDRIFANIGLWRSGAYVAQGSGRPTLYAGGYGTSAWIVFPDVPVKIENGDILTLRAANASGARGSASYGILTAKRL